jgi:hypothetical protein
VPSDVASLPPTARVTVSRTDARDVQQRQIYARIDDTATRTLMFGDSFTVDVAPGAHTLKVNNTLYWKSVQFTVEPGEHVEFALINQSSRLSFGFLAVLGAGPLRLVIERRPARSAHRLHEQM